MAISKQLLISLLFITLMFTAFGVNTDHSYAVDLNESVGDDLGVELDVEDKLENSQTNEILEATYTLDGGTFGDIQTMVNNADSGDRIRLSGTFVPRTVNDTITINKQLTITSSSTATLDGQGISSIFKIKSKAAGTIINNLRFVNGYNDIEGGAMRIGAKNVTIQNCVFDNNRADISAGAIFTSYTPQAAENIKIKNCNFTNNGGAEAAGALGVYGYNFLIENCIFDSNTAKRYENAYGGAVQVGSDVEITYGVLRNCVFKNNRAISTNGVSHGGAGCVRNGTHYINCVFINNTADHGGALTYHSSGSLENCKFYDNTANRYGGAVSISLEHTTMNLNITNCLFDGNKAPLGGAVRLSGMNIKIQNSNFTDNRATEYGGAVNINAVNVDVENSRFNDNVADINGGALYINGRNTVVKGSSFIGNDAIPDTNKRDDGLGGAIYVNSTQAFIENNVFRLNTARNGSAVYYDKFGENLKLTNNIMEENQAWVYLLPVSAHDIYYGESENIKSVIYGGNNIARYNDLTVSNAIYNAASNQNIEINGERPVSGATMNGHLYQDDREYSMNVLLTVTHEDGTVVYNQNLRSTYLGEVSAVLNGLKPGKYYVKSTHYEDTYYKAITNTTTFRVIPMVDNKILKSANSAEEFNYDDYVMWTLEITNNGPNNATQVVVNDVLPQGVEYVNDTSGGKYDSRTGILTIGNLAVGKTITVKILTKIKKTGEIKNRANVTANEYDIDLTNNMDDATIHVNPAVDLQVTKSVNNTNPRYGDSVDWTIVVKNNGPDVATDVKVSDILPNSLIYSRSTGSYNVNTGSWNVGTLNAGSSVTLHLITKVNATGLIKNNVSVSGREHDRDLSNNFDEDEINVNPASDLAIVKTVNATSANYGDLVKWTLTVTNNGPDRASGVYVMDTLPNGFTYVDSRLQRGSYSNGKITIGNMAAGERLTFDIITRVGATGTFTNVATVTGNEYDYDLTNNKDNASILINIAADLQVTKTVNNTNPNYHDVVDWTITVKNNGPNVATSINVVDILPRSLVYVSATGSYNVNTHKWFIAALNVGKSVSFHIKTKVNATGLIRNDVSVSGQEYDYNPSNNFDNESVNVNPATDLAVVKTVNATSANYGDLVKWTLTVTNNGPSRATGVYVKDTLPDGFTYVSSRLQRGSYSNGKITIGNMAAGERLTFDIITRVGATGTFTNVANVTGNEYDYDLTNNRDTESILINPAADLQVTKGVNNSNPRYNDLVDWTIVVKNNGPDVATNVKVVDALPKTLIYVSSTGNYNSNTNTWSVGTLNVGSSVTLHLVTKVNTTGVIENNVSVSGKEYDYNMENNFDNEPVNVNPASDLAIVKTVNATSANYGDLVKWTLTVTNNGPDKATGVYVIDTLPRGFVYVSSNLQRGSYSNGRITIGNIAVGERLTFDIITRVGATGTFTNVANVTGNEYDYDLTNNRDTESILINPAADLQVTKGVNNSNPNYLDLVDWTITVKNNGPDRATNIKVVDVLPKSLIYVSSTGNYNVNTKTWTVAALNAGSSTTLHIIAKVNATGIIENNVSVSGKEYDYNPENNFDNELITVNPSSDLAIVKAVNATSANYGDLVKWTLTVTNNGPDKATGVYVIDTLPRGFVYVSSNLQRGSYSNGRITIGNIAVGERLTFDIITRVNATGTFTNVANVTGNEYDHDLTNNRDTESILIPPAADLQVSKNVNNSNPRYHDLVDWTITVKNNGPDRATNVKVVDVLPRTLIYISSSGNYNVNTGTWTVGTLNVGSSATLHIKAKVNATGVIENIATVSGKEYDQNPSNNVDKENITVKPASDLAIVKAVNVTSANYGDLVKWTLTVTNNGPDKATGVYVIDTLPRGFVYVSSNLQRGSYSNGRITIGNIAVGERLTFDIITKVNATGTFTNVANVTGKEYDYDLSNNNDTESILIHPAADLKVTKAVNDTNPDYGKSITWTITVKNNGPDRATNVKVIDVLPDSLIWQSDSGRGKYNHETGLWNVGEIANGASATLKIVCKVNRTGLTTNDVNVTAKEYDYNPGNNHDNETIDVAPASDLEVTKSVNCTNPNYHDLIKWTVVIKNNGPDDAHNVYVDEIIPDGLVMVSYTKTKGIYDNGVWAMCCLNNSEVQTLEIICKVNKTGEIINLVAIHGDEYDPDPSNNENNASIDVPPSADLELIKDVNNTRPYYGDKIMWTVIIKNNGPDNATGVVVDDVISPRLEFVEYESSKGVFKANKWNVGNLNVGCVEYLNITCITRELGEVSNYAEVKSNEYDWNEANNYDVATAQVYPSCDLAIEKMVDNAKPNYGDYVTWTLIVANNGPNNASDVTVFDTLPEGLIFVESSSEDYQDGIWNIGHLNVGDSRELEIICKVSATGKFVNNATVVGAQTDLDLSNNHASESINVPPASDISITKVASKYHYYVGEIVRYTIEVVNNGPDRADNVEVSEVMDDSLKLKSFHASAGDFNKLTKTWEIDSLEAGESASLLIDAVAAEEGIADNRVTASSDNYDPDLSNNDDFASVNVTEDKPDVSKNSGNPKDIVNNDVPDEMAEKILEKNVSGNSFFILLISLIFSMVFLGGNFSKRK